MKLTPYQEHLLTPKPVTWNMWISRLVESAILIVLCYGLWLETQEALPIYLTGWLSFGLICYIVLSIFLAFIACICVLAMRLMSAFVERILDSEDTIYNEDETRYQLIIKQFVKSVASRKSVYFVCFFVLKLVLAVLLVSANHPVLGGLCFLSQIALYANNLFLKRYILNIVTRIKDPLEMTEKVDIDELMNKLTEPPQDWPSK